ncbi:MAG: ricin-type beta-trefoil lectin domain protein [Polyangiaceae bacterium]
MTNYRRRSLTAPRVSMLLCAGTLAASLAHCSSTVTGSSEHIGKVSEALTSITLPGPIAGQFRASGGRCLDVGATGDGAPHLYDCNSSSFAQSFRFSNGQLRSVVSGLCLDIANGNIAAGVLDMKACNLGTNQQWSIFDDGSLRGPSNTCVEVLGNNQNNNTTVHLATCGAPPGPAQLWSLGIRTQIQAAGGRCLDVYQNNPHIADCNGTDPQNFLFSPIAALGGNGTIINPATGLCLDIVGDGLGMTSCANLTTQHWTLSGDTIRSAIGLCLDVKSQNAQTPVDLDNCFGSTDQQWAVDGAPTQIIGPGGKCLDIVNGWTRFSGASVQTYQCNSTPAQEFVFNVDGTISNPQGGLCLTATTFGSASMTTCNGGSGQQWHRDKSRIVSSSGLYLDVYGDSIDNHGTIDVVGRNGTTAQYWRIPEDFVPGPATINWPWLALLCEWQDLAGVDPQTPEFYKNYFTEVGVGTGGMFDYMKDNSNGVLDMTGSIVRGWYTMPAKQFDGLSREQTIATCLQTAKNADPSIDETQYAGVAAFVNTVWDVGRFGHGLDDGTDNLNVNVVPQEVTHVYQDISPAPHARSSTGVEYGDPFDVMGCGGGAGCYKATGGNYSTFGPSINAGFRFKYGWLPFQSTPILTNPGTYSETLSALGGAGTNAVIVSPANPSPDRSFYVVEYRNNNGWDLGLPNFGILVHWYRPRSPSDNPSADANPSTYLLTSSLLLSGQTYIGTGFTVTANSFPGTTANVSIFISSGTSNPLVPPGGILKLLSQSSATLTAFAPGTDGALYVRQLKNAVWTAATPLSSVGFAAAEAAVSMGKQTTSTSDAFVVGNDGAVSKTSETSDAPWQIVSPLTSAGFAPPGAHLATANQGGQLGVFVVDSNGTLQVIWWNPLFGWLGPVALTSANYAPPGAPLATGTRANGELDVYVSDGSLKYMAFNLGVWSGPYSLTASNFAPPGAPVAAALDVHGFMNVFTVGNDGAVYTKWDATPLWSGPTALTATGFARPGSELSAATGSALNAFVVDATGTIDVLSNAGLSWQGPTAISDVGVAMPGASTSAAIQGGQLHLLAVTLAGVVESVNGGSGWSLPVSVP